MLADCSFKDQLWTYFFSTDGVLKHGQMVIQNWKRLNTLVINDSKKVVPVWTTCRTAEEYLGTRPTVTNAVSVPRSPSPSKIAEIGRASTLWRETSNNPSQAAAAAAQAAAAEAAQAAAAEAAEVNFASTF